MKKILLEKPNEENGLRKEQLFCSIIHSTVTIANQYELSKKYINIIIIIWNIRI